jgi:hypothetical protein
MEPQWKGPFEAYARTFARKHHWRVARLCDDVEDAVQQCAVVFCHLAKIYPHVNRPEWFMGLYKQALTNAFNSMARINKEHAAVAAAIDDGYLLAPRHEEPNHLAAALAGASRELQQVLRVMGNAPRELLSMMLLEPRSQRGKATEAAISRGWCRLARADTVREDLVSELRELLQ